jgi:beta-galactosidase
MTSEGADVVATFVGGELDGRPAVLRNAAAEGTAWYVGTLPDREAMTRFLRRVCEQAGVRPVVTDLPAGLEAVRRGPYLFLLNHTDEPATVTVGDDPFTIQAGDVLIRKEGP